MAIFEKALEADIMSTHMLIRADVSKPILYQAYSIATEFEKRYSAYKKDSFLNKINAMAGLEPVICSDEDIELFKRAISVSKETNGAFDITIGALSHGAYHFGFRDQKIASKENIEKQICLVDYNNIFLENNTLFLKEKGMRLDLGGIGKGYVAKKIAIFLKDNGAKEGLINVGGEIVSFGKSYTIALQDPFSSDNFLYFKTSKEPISISTSGDYERFIGSKEHNHILNTKSGISSNLYSSMSIIKNGFDIDMLDAYATAMSNNSIEDIKRSANILDFSAILIDKESDCSMIRIQKLDYKNIYLQPIHNKSTY
ncbi:FAD:protein FMN transferase [bacterium]|nr:FAD:protein FMN transferase [bacterium]MBU1884540.1 FAD:protein FMN transferase [bacterium]